MSLWELYELQGLQGSGSRAWGTFRFRDVGISVKGIDVLGLRVLGKRFELLRVQRLGLSGTKPSEGHKIAW